MDISQESVMHGQCDFPINTALSLPLGRYSFTTEGRRLSWPKWLVTYKEGIAAVTHLSCVLALR